ncbi:MAG: hypothetical protein NVSMB32_10450 [Actinomycetota bacterium]
MEGVPLPALVCCSGDLWAGRAELAAPDSGIRSYVTVIARGVAYEQLALAWVEDLRPYLTEHRRMLRDYLEHPLAVHTAPPVSDAVRTFVDVSLRQTYLRRGAGIGDRIPKGASRVSGEEYLAFWEAAVDLQTERTKDRNDAHATIESIEEHINELVVACPWFRSDAYLRGLAIDETVAHAARGQTVASQRAQEMWEQRRDILRVSFEDEGDPPTDEMAALVATMRRQEDLRDGDARQWVKEWDLWAQVMRR